MNGSGNESQIDLFLEHVKRSAARAMEDRSSDGWLSNENLVHSIVKRSRSGMSSSDDGTVQSSEEKKLIAVSLINSGVGNQDGGGILTREMESLGEVGVLMNMSGDSGGEILKTLLSASKVPKSEHIVLHDFENDNHNEDQLVLHIEVPEPIIQHVPITFLTADNPNIPPLTNRTFVEPATFVLTRDVLSDSGFSSLARQEPQKIILVQEVDTRTPQTVYSSSEGRVFAVNEGPKGCSGLWGAGEGVSKPCAVSGAKCEVAVKMEETAKECRRRKQEPGRRGKVQESEKSVGSNTKVQKKISTGKKPPGKRKNSKLKTKAKAVGKGLGKVGEEGSGGAERERQKLFELTKLEDNVGEVEERLKVGCECSESNCFDGLNAEEVFKHRLNIADLTKAEHDMYLMGVIMASIHNLEETCRHKERIRIRSCYAYQGKKVCLTAFLYLQHVTLYQMKRLRSHLKNHGVSPRIHGNRGRKPANTLSLDIYRRATTFFQSYIEKHCVRTVPNFTNFSSIKVPSTSIAGESKLLGKNNPTKASNKMTSYHLPPECTKRRVHREYKFYCENLKVSQKVMKYSTFTNFLKKQFPNVKFQKREEKKKEGTKGEEWERKSREDVGVDKSVQVATESDFSGGWKGTAKAFPTDERHC